MKRLMFAVLAAAIATPALAQTTPPADPAPTQSMPMPTAPAADPAMPEGPGTAPMAPPPAPMPMAAPAAADGPYPMCSRTVTDHCTERSNARGERKHSTPRPRR